MSLSQERLIPFFADDSMVWYMQFDNGTVYCNCQGTNMTGQNCNVPLAPTPAPSSGAPTPSTGPTSQPASAPKPTAPSPAAIAPSNTVQTNTCPQGYGSSRNACATTSQGALKQCHCSYWISSGPPSGREAVIMQTGADRAPLNGHEVLSDLNMACMEWLLALQWCYWCAV